jgi:hypothetical protein
MLREVHLQLVRLAGVEGAWRSSHIDDPPLVLFHPPLFFIYVFLSFRIKKLLQNYNENLFGKEDREIRREFHSNKPQTHARVLDQFGGG